MVELRDILLKAAEDVQSGMWCKDEYFESTSESAVLPFDFLRQHPDVEADEQMQSALERALKTRRCALGSLALATKLLGGEQDEWDAASFAVQDELARRGHDKSVAEYNDLSLPDDPFEAGQQLAELFRKTAEEL